MAQQQRELGHARRRPTALILVVLVGVAVLALVIMAGLFRSDDGEGDEAPEPITTEDSIEVPVERGIPGAGDDPSDD